ncbi:hypothetical protein BOX15_Mlig031079g1, partial [Macrostomum lignano]
HAHTLIIVSTMPSHGANVSEKSSLVSHAGPSYHAMQRGTSSDSEAGLHCHASEQVREQLLALGQRTARRKLWVASLLCLLFMAGEIVGGAIANSLAIMTDAAHLLTDFASFMISLLALYLASRPATKRMSFGWHRAEVVGALVSVLMIWVVTGILVYLAIERVVNQNFEVQGQAMLITSGVGVAVNIIMAVTLHQHGHSLGTDHGHSHANNHGNDDHGHSDQNINVRAAFIHVVGDFLQSLGVLCAAFVIYYRPDLKLADPICTFLFSILVLFTTFSILRDTMRVLMEATPKGLDFNIVKETLASVPGVIEVHNLRLWSLTMNKTAVSAHLAVVKDANQQELLLAATRLVKQRFQLHEVTVQIEEYVEAMADCEHCQDPQD